MTHIEGLAASVAAVELRKAGLDGLADAVEYEFTALRVQRDAARGTACRLEAELNQIRREQKILDPD